MVDAPFGKIPRDLFYSEPDIDMFRAQQFTTGWEFEHRLNDGLVLGLGCESGTGFAELLALAEEALSAAPSGPLRAIVSIDSSGTSMVFV